MINQKKLKIIRSALELIFQSIDKDKNGGIDMGEFHNFFISFKVCDKSISDAVFSQIDINDDISLDQEGKKI